MAYIKGSKISVGARKGIAAAATQAGEGKAYRREVYKELFNVKPQKKGIIR